MKFNNPMRRLFLLLLLLLFTGLNSFCQTIILDASQGGKTFDGVGAVSGGGATSVLLKNYPEPQRSQVLDLLFKPKFGASMSALYVEIPGDGNSTQGTELSHMHSRNDLNFSRGYEWWLMKEAKNRNPLLSLDGCGWSAPGWVGNGNFASKDMCNYYVQWIKGLKSTYGLDMDAIGYRNEKGVNEAWVKMFRKMLDSAGLQKVLIHGFDNWEKKWDWVKDMRTDTAHTNFDAPAPLATQQLADSLHKPIWNTEEHVYKHGFDCEISLVHVFNENYIKSGVTKILSWYLVSAFYPVESFHDVTVIDASSPWSGHYKVNPALWAYAHYGQFAQIGWKYLGKACGNLSDSGSYITLSNGKDYSCIIESKGAKIVQNITFKILPGLSTGKLCVWKSDRPNQFVKVNDIVPVDGQFSLTVAPNSIYTISTTTGQQKGVFDSIPSERKFPFPYYERFSAYQRPQQWGFLPRYTADITGAFELARRPDGDGYCLRQVLTQKANSWAPEWMPYTILGDSTWTDYEVSAGIHFDNGGWAGVLGRVSNTGTGYGCNPLGYYLRLYVNGKVALYASNQLKNGDPGKLLAQTNIRLAKSETWNNVKLQFKGKKITGFVNNKPVLTVFDTTYTHGLAGLVTGGDNDVRNTAMFDQIAITPNNYPKQMVTKRRHEWLMYK
jgi:galactosylceramidase